MNLIHLDIKNVDKVVKRGWAGIMYLVNIFTIICYAALKRKQIRVFVGLQQENIIILVHFNLVMTYNRREVQTNNGLRNNQNRVLPVCPDICNTKREKKTQQTGCQNNAITNVSQETGLQYAPIPRGPTSPQL